MNSPTTGYLYIATGDKYIQEAIVSATSLKKLNDRAQISLVTDEKLNHPLFDEIITPPVKIENFQQGLLYKVRHIYEASPYDRTLFIDTDTYFCEDCQDIFETLDFFDLALVPAPSDLNKAKSPKTQQILKACVPYNTGVILFKKSLNNDFLFKRWLEIFEAKVVNNSLRETWETDQTSFIEAWLEAQSKVYVLSYAWNARTPLFLNFSEPVKIIHGRHDDYERIEKELNKPRKNTPAANHRCWLPVENRCITLEEVRQKNFKLGSTEAFQSSNKTDFS